MGRTPLHLCCLDKNYASVKMECILSYHYSNINKNKSSNINLINMKDNNGNTALHLACMTLNDSELLKCINVIDKYRNGNKNKSVRMDILNKKHKTSLLIACEKKEYSQNTLLQLCKNNFKNSRNILNDIVYVKSKKGRMNILAYCISFDRIEMVRFLLEQLIYCIEFKLQIQLQSDDDNDNNNNNKSKQKTLITDKMCELLEEKIGNNFGMNCVELARWSVPALNTLLKEFYNAAKSKDESKMRALVDAIERNQERLIKQYWKIRQQNYFCQVFLQEKQNTRNNSAANEILNVILNGLIKKLPLSDDLLVLSWRYCETQNIQVAMLKILKLVIADALSYKNVSKARDYAWFVDYMLNSNIWYQYANKNSNSNAFVYDEILDTVNKELYNQKLFLQKKILSIMSLKNEEFKAFNKLCDLKEIGISDSIRQDNLKCNKPEYSAYELIATSESDFDSEKEYDTRIYLINLLIKARELNTRFQKQMKLFVSIINSNAIYQNASIKKYDRCVEKSQVDYVDAKWPRTAKLIDIIRCSITFNSCKEMYDALMVFKHRVDHNQGDCIKKILRIKNGFSTIKNWKNTNDFEYRDIKLNVLISNNDNSKQIIGEIQFLLSLMLNVKQMGHSLYQITRRFEFVDSLKKLINHNNNNINETIKMKQVIKNKDYTSFKNQILLNNDTLLNMSLNNTDRPLLFDLFGNNWFKASKLFIGSVYHYDYCNNMNGKYINNFVNKILDHKSMKFFGFDIKTIMKLKNDPKKNMMKRLVFESSYMGQFEDENIIYNCVCMNMFEYLQLIRNYRSNDIGIINGINKTFNIRTNETNASNESTLVAPITPLMKLMTLPHCNEQWIGLLLSFKNNNSLHIKATTDMLNQFWQICNQTATVNDNSNSYDSKDNNDTDNDSDNDSDNGSDLNESKLSMTLRGQLWYTLIGMPTLDSNDYEEQIAKKEYVPTYVRLRGDTKRTFAWSGEYLSRVGEESLVRVLNSFSNKYLQAYVQGMNVVAGYLLYTMPELHSYHVFCKIAKELCPTYWYSDNTRRKDMTGAWAGSFLAWDLLRIFDNELFDHIKLIPPHMYFFPLMVGFQGVSKPFSQLIKLMDFLLCFGVCYNPVIAASQLIANRNSILRVKSHRQLISSVLSQLKWMNGALSASKVITVAVCLISKLYNNNECKELLQHIQDHATDFELCQLIRLRHEQEVQKIARIGGS